MSTFRPSCIWLTAIAMIFLIALPAGAQTEVPIEPSVASEPPPVSPAWTVGAFVDVGYLHSFNDPPNRLFRSRGTTWHLHEWHLNMAGAYIRRVATAASRWGGELMVHTGKDDEVFGFSATAPVLSGASRLRHLGPANASLLAPVGRGLTLQAGIFSSLIGYDSLYAKDNLNYTRPWGADFTPYLMMGANASYPLTDEITGTLFIVNGYWHLANANRVPSSGAQLAFKPNPRVTVKQAVLLGPHQSNTSAEFWRVLSDTIVERKTERLTIAMNANVATERVDAVPPFRAWWASTQVPVRGRCGRPGVWRSDPSSPGIRKAGGLWPSNTSKRSRRRSNTARRFGEPKRSYAWSIASTTRAGGRAASLIITNRVLAAWL